MKANNIITCCHCNKSKFITNGITKGHICSELSIELNNYPVIPNNCPLEEAKPLFIDSKEYLDAYNKFYNK